MSTVDKQPTTTTKHWHVASGLSGYGPESNTLFSSADDLVSLLPDIIAEIRTWIDLELGVAEGYAETEQYKNAWFMMKHAENMLTLTANLDPERAEAPIHRNDPALWAVTVAGMVAASFPLDVNEDRSRIYVWECQEANDVCEHYLFLMDGDHCGQS